MSQKFWTLTSPDFSIEMLLSVLAVRAKCVERQILPRIVKLVTSQVWVVVYRQLADPNNAHFPPCLTVDFDLTFLLLHHLLGSLTWRRAKLALQPCFVGAQSKGCQGLLRGLVDDQHIDPIMRVKQVHVLQGTLKGLALVLCGTGILVKAGVIKKDPNEPVQVL